MKHLNISTIHNYYVNRLTIRAFNFKIVTFLIISRLTWRVQWWLAGEVDECLAPTLQRYRFKWWFMWRSKYNVISYIGTHVGIYGNGEKKVVNLCPSQPLVTSMSSRKICPLLHLPIPIQKLLRQGRHVMRMLPPPPDTHTQAKTPRKILYLFQSRTCTGTRTAQEPLQDQH